MGYFNVCIKDDVSYTDKNFKTLEEVFDYSANNNGPARVLIETSAEDVHFFGKKLASFKSSVVDDLKRTWVIEYFVDEYPGEGEGYVDMVDKLKNLGVLK